MSDSLSQNIKKLLHEHIKYLDYHSAKENTFAGAFKWNTPVMNEFIAFGKYLLKHYGCSTSKGTDPSRDGKTE